MKVKTIIYCIIALAFAGVIIYKAVWSNPAQAKIVSQRVSRAPLSVNIQVLKPEVFVETLSVTGSIEANEEVILKSEVSGKITGIFFEEGTYINKGTLLIKVYDDDLQAQLAKAQVNLKLTKDVEARQKQLLDREAISRQEYDVALANLQSAEADIAILQSQISKTEIRASFDGTIGFRQVSPGEYITPGTDIASLVSNNPVKIQFSVPEKYSSVIGKKTVVKYRIEGIVDERTASVYAIEPTIDAATRTLQLKALTPNPNGLLVPGAFVKIDVQMEAKPKALMIPAEAIIPETAGQKVFIYRNGAAEPVMVETGTRTNNRVEIIKGLAAGDSVVTTGIMQITPRIKVVPAKIN